MCRTTTFIWCPLMGNPTNVYAFYRNLETGEYILDEETGKPIAMSESVYNSYRDAYGVTFGEPLNGGRHYVYVVGSSGNTCSMPYHSSNRKRNFNDGGTTWQNPRWFYSWH